MKKPLTDRQQREIDYHREHARQHLGLLSKPFSWDVLEHPGRRWWNAYWQMYAHLVNCDLQNKDVLVVGCGFGDDALRMSRLGANVKAFDLDAESLGIARELAKREGLRIDFEEMPAESMLYPDSSFDVILARDILHHVDIPAALREVARVARPNALFIVNEVYTHTLTDKLRHSSLIERFIYPMMRGFIYGQGKPYITEDERKLNESDVQAIIRQFGAPEFFRHYNLIVTRLLPDRYEVVAKLDQLLLRVLKPLGLVLAGRVLFASRIRK